MEKKPNLLLFNTLTRKKEEFVPIAKGKVRMYTCGPTVYDFAHIGNMRAFVFEDQLRRWLEYRGFEITHVMNITDVDDRTINGSKRQGIPLSEYTESYTKVFFDDIDALNIERATLYPRATQHIPEMVALVKKLLDKGYAYRGEDGSIYFSIAKFKNYGQLSKLKIEELKPGARVKVDDYEKEEARDFALWKAWDAEDGNVFWETDVGKGRPGWHIECSAMSIKYLGETFDIHCGGVDNMFPHHENEIAQSEGATGKKFVDYWMHNEHLLVEGKKMAKRLGNYFTLRDLLDRGYDRRAIRYLLMSTHYRQQLNFTFDGLKAAASALDRLTNLMHRLLDAKGESRGKTTRQLITQVKKGFEEAMDDDLDIGIALGVIFDFVRDVNRLIDENALSSEEAKEVQQLMADFDKVLGVIGEVKKEERLPKDAEELLRQREEARNRRDWETADKIRERLKETGIIVEDTPQGVRWHREKSG